MEKQVPMELAPLRSLDDFLLSKARFQIPDIKNEDRWFNRVVHNFLYYQTNYFVTGFIIFLLVAYAHPKEMGQGLGVMAVVLGVAFYVQGQRLEVQRFRHTHPVLFSLALTVVVGFLVHTLDCVVVFLTGVILPIVFVLMHASLRLRNVRNKLANATEALGLAKRTPMAYFLNGLGIEPDLKYLS